MNLCAKYLERHLGNEKEKHQLEVIYGYQWSHVTIVLRE